MHRRELSLSTLNGRAGSEGGCSVGSTLFLDIAMHTEISVDRGFLNLHCTFSVSMTPRDIDAGRHQHADGGVLEHLVEALACDPTC